MPAPNDSRQVRAALDKLRDCTSDELKVIESRIGAIKVAVALRERFASKPMLMPHVRIVPRDDGEGGLDLKPDPGLRAYVAGAVDGKSVPDDEDDEPDDLDATPLESVGPPSECDVIEAQAFFRVDGGHDEPRGPHQ